MMNRVVAAVVLIGASVLAYAGESQNVTLEVKGMHCASCPLTVKVVLKSLPGVDDVKMDAEKHTAEVRFDSAKISVEQLAQAVTEAGYPAKPRK
jgi:periplasmic mercuric ion binding protein